MINVVGSMVRAVKRLCPVCLLMIVVDEKCVVVVAFVAARYV